jgi:hypothetical protein
MTLPVRPFDVLTLYTLFYEGSAHKTCHASQTYA